jgi:nitrate reductase assembly molybdenum cofactor insertion protein NarJ
MGQRKRLRKIKSGNKRVRAALEKNNATWQAITACVSTVAAMQMQVVMNSQKIKTGVQNGEVVYPFDKTQNQG